MTPTGRFNVTHSMLSPVPIAAMIIVPFFAAQMIGLVLPKHLVQMEKVIYVIT
jgi:hypothetical protein